VNGSGISGQTSDVLSSNFTSGDSVTCEVISSDGTLDSAAGSSSVTITNRPPEISSVTLSPDPAYANDAITASAIAADLDGDSLSFEYTWSVAGIPVQAGSGNSLDISFYEKNDLVSVSVEAFDQTDFSSPVVESITISNTPPTTPGISISPTAPIEGTDDLVCTVDSASSDIDGDSISYSFSWTVDGTPYSNATDTSMDSTVAGTETFAGEEWICSVTPNDGTNNGGSVDSNVTIDADWAGVLEFTNCGQTGQNGPSQSQCDSEYSGTTLDGLVTLSGGFQTWTVPNTGTYQITTYGAKGGSTYHDGGNGATLQGDFSLTAGQQLKILVGQMGSNGDMSSGGSNGGGGGGGTFVSLSGNTPLIVTGGGGGSTAGYQCSQYHGTQCIGGPGNDSDIGDGAGCGGSYSSCQGSGWSYDGDGESFLSGGQGGTSNYNGDGGFGGGGGAVHHPGGGGGGYHGGDCGFNFPTSNSDGCGGSNNGRGGFSYNSGANGSGSSNANNGHGYVTIDKL
jgi:hypothetical protein